MAEKLEALETVWFYEHDGERKGPVGEAELVGMIRGLRITYGAMVWHKDLPAWTRLEDSSLASHLGAAAPPPLPGSRVNNTLVWVLAFAPLIGLFLEGMLAYLVMGSEYLAEQAVQDGKFFLVTVGLNIALAFLDEKRLKKAGYDTAKFKGWVWLVPVYLYQRAGQLQQSLAYFIVWIVCFVVVLASLV